MKISKVLPVFKKSKKSSVSNYRPISLLPQISKILEKIITFRLTDFLNNNNIITECQYGFKNNHSTVHAVLDATNFISSALDKNKFVMGIFVDLKKAFDTVDHTILIEKLEHYGLRVCQLTS